MMLVHYDAEHGSNRQFQHGFIVATDIIIRNKPNVRISISHAISASHA